MNSHTVRQAENKGSIVRDCPGTSRHVCCGYKTIDLIEGCPLSCSYCILKGYLNRAGISVHNDTAYILEQVERAISEEKQHVLRFGTGELSDSLALDRKLGLNRPIVQFFGQSKKALLELKSKWASIGHLRSCLNPYTVVSFSLAPQASIDREEKEQALCAGDSRRSKMPRTLDASWVSISTPSLSTRGSKWTIIPWWTTSPG